MKPPLSRIGPALGRPIAARDRAIYAVLRPSPEEIDVVIKRIGVLKAGIVQSCIMAFFGLLIGLCLLFFGTLLGGLFGAIGDQAGAGLGLGLIGGVGMLIFLPITYAVIGFVAGVVGAAVYNLVAGFVGGIEIEVE